MEKQILIVIATCLAGILFLTSSQASPVPDAVRVRRSSSDQRIAELQALLALTGNGGRVAHGQFDPLRIGKKKRDFTDEQRYQLLRSLVERAALENTANLPNWWRGGQVTNPHPVNLADRLCISTVVTTTGESVLVKCLSINIAPPALSSLPPPPSLHGYAHPHRTMPVTCSFMCLLRAATAWTTRPPSQVTAATDANKDVCLHQQRH